MRLIAAALLSRGAQLVLVSASKGGPEVLLTVSTLAEQDQRGLHPVSWTRTSTHHLGGVKHRFDRILFQGVIHFSRTDHWAVSTHCRAMVVGGWRRWRGNCLLGCHEVALFETQRSAKERGARMITLRKAGEREHVRRRKHERWLTLFPQDQSGLLADGFGHLRAFEEGRLAPRVSRRHPIKEEAEIITYVREGTLAYEDSTGRSGIISAGEFQRMTAGPGIRYGETNTSPTKWAHVFQLWLHPAVVGLEPGHEQKRFSVPERRGIKCIVASPEVRKGSLRLHQDALLFSSILERGQHLVHELSVGRSAWLHIVQGAVRCGSTLMSTGDGAGIQAELAVSVTATEATEILLLDLGDLGTVAAVETGSASSSIPLSRMNGRVIPKPNAQTGGSV